MLVGTGEPRVVMRCPRPTPISLQVVSPTISSPVCQEQLIEAGKLVDRSVENCVRACQAATDDTELLKQVSAAASVVSQALHDLLQHVRQFASRGEPIGRYDQATDTIMCVTESIFSSMGDAGEELGCGLWVGQAVWGSLMALTVSKSDDGFLDAW